MRRPALALRLAEAARRRGTEALERRLAVVDARDGAMVERDGRRLVSFCSNDYLGLSQHLDVVAALQEAAAMHGVGASASALVSGHHREHARLEEEVADWLGCERALAFGSGYLANLGVMQALLDEDAVCVQDKLNHACLLDGARLAGAHLKRYPHGDYEGALRQLRAAGEAPAMLATEGVFSMDGDLAPLKALALLARAENALFYVDDAHGAGVLGPEGRGSVAAAGLGAREVPLRLVTFGKAFGGQGAVVAGQADLVEALVQDARSYLFATALPPPLAAAARAALAVSRRESWRRIKLAGMVARFRRGAQQLGLPLLDSVTPIQPVMVGDNAGTLAVAGRLAERGFLVGAIRPPTVPAGRARLRVSLSALHTEAQVDALLEALASALRGQRDAATAAG